MKLSRTNRLLLSAALILISAGGVSWLASRSYWVRSWRTRPGPVIANFSTAPGELAGYLDRIRDLPLADPMLSADSDGVLYSVAAEGRHAIHRRVFATGQDEVIPQLTPTRDHFYPIRLAPGIDALTDELGDQDFHFSGALRQDLSSIRHLSRAFNLAPSNALLVIAKPEWNREVAYYLVPSEGHYRVADSLALEGLYNGHALSADGQRLVIASSGGMWAWNPQAQREPQLAEALPGEKAGPTLDEKNHKLYFSVVDASGYREIFTLDYAIDHGNRHFATDPQPFLQNGRDKSQLTVRNGYLYFVEDDGTSYLLKRCRLPSTKVEDVTSKGVIYRYVLSPKDEVWATYSDVGLPLRLVHLVPGEALVPAANEAQFSLGTPRALQPEGLSPAWVFEPAEKPRAVVLTIHGGPDINVSPRWDPAFDLWLKLGVVVVAPNYPGSRGFGAKYLKSPPDESVTDLEGWLSWSRVNYPNVPVIVEGMSYGGELAQKVIARDRGRLDGIIFRSTRLQNPPADRTLPPVLVQFGAHDALVDAGEVWNALFDWKRAAPGRLFFQSFTDEGHLIRSGADRSASLAGMASFLARLLAKS